MRILTQILIILNLLGCSGVQVGVEDKDQKGKKSSDSTEQKLNSKGAKNPKAPSPQEPGRPVGDTCQAEFDGWVLSEVTKTCVYLSETGCSTKRNYFETQTSCLEHFNLVKELRYFPAKAYDRCSIGFAWNSSWPDCADVSISEGNSCNGDGAVSSDPTGDFESPVCNLTDPKIGPTGAISKYGTVLICRPVDLQC